MYLKNKYYYSFPERELQYWCYSRGGWYICKMQQARGRRLSESESFWSREQQKNNSVLNVKKPLAPKELIFVCRFRLFNVDLLTLNINPSKALSLSLLLSLSLPYLFLWHFNNLEQYNMTIPLFIHRFISHCYSTLMY